MSVRKCENMQSLSEFRVKFNNFACSEIWSNLLQGRGAADDLDDLFRDRGLADAIHVERE